MNALLQQSSRAYGYPSPTITGEVDRDIMFVEKVLGVKLAISDHRAPNVTESELIQLASKTRTAGMLSGKPGIVVLHMGDADAGLSPVFRPLQIPVVKYDRNPVFCQLYIQLDPISHLDRALKRRERIFRTFAPVVMKSPVGDVLPLKCLHSRLPPRLRQHTAVKQR